MPITVEIELTLRLDKVRNWSARLKGDGGPQITIEMEYLPSLSSNRRLTRNRYTKHTVLRSDVESWMEQLGFMVQVVMNSCQITFRLPVRIIVGAEYPTHVYPDTSNLHKAIGDGIKGGLGIDDKYYCFHDEPVKVIPGCEKKLVISIQEATKG